MEIYGGAVWRECHTTPIGDADTDEEAADLLWWLPHDRALAVIRQARDTGRPVLAGYAGPGGLQADPPTGQEPVGESRYGDPVYGSEEAPIEPYYVEVAEA